MAVLAIITPATAIRDMAASPPCSFSASASADFSVFLPYGLANIFVSLTLRWIYFIHDFRPYMIPRRVCKKNPAERREDESDHWVAVLRQITD